MFATFLMLTLMEAIEKDLAGRRIEEFYFARW